MAGGRLRGEQVLELMKKAGYGEEAAQRAATRWEAKRLEEMP